MSQKYYYFRVPNQAEAAGQMERVKEANFFAVESVCARCAAHS
jgi:hypothetical protein